MFKKTVILSLILGVVAVSVICNNLVIGAGLLGFTSLALYLNTAFPKLKEEHLCMVLFLGLTVAAMAVTGLSVIGLLSLGVFACVWTLDSRKLGYVCAAAFCGLMVYAATDTMAFAEGIEGVARRFTTGADAFKTLIPSACYVGGIGVGVAGLHEVVKSQQGHDGDLGKGIKKSLIGGGIAGAGKTISMMAETVSGSGIN